jgi:hypothetical protein
VWQAKRLQASLFHPAVGRLWTKSAPKP